MADGRVGRVQLLMVRHALPLRIDHAAQGADPGLAEVGVAQAARVPDALARHRIVRIVASPQARARQTAESTAVKLGIDVEIVDGIAEYDHGLHAYIPIEDTKTEFPAVYDRIKSGHLPEHIDGPAFISRVVEAVGALAATCDHDDSIVAFTHGGVINSYVQNVLGSEKTLAFPIDYCSITRILFSRNGRRTVASVNETEHVWDLLPRNRNR